MASPPYTTRAYRAAKAELVGAPCWMCGKPSTTVDHYPPLSAFPPGRWVGTFRPACQPCQHAQGERLARERYHGSRPALPSRVW